MFEEISLTLRAEKRRSRRREEERDAHVALVAPEGLAIATVLRVWWRRSSSSSCRGHRQISSSSSSSLLSLSLSLLIFPCGFGFLSVCCG